MEKISSSCKFESHPGKKLITHLEKVAELNHIEKNKLFYRYPLIQYKVIKNAPMIIGIREGVDILKSIYDKVDSLQINNKER